jgi:hypothetical protein
MVVSLFWMLNDVIKCYTLIFCSYIFFTIDDITSCMYCCIHVGAPGLFFKPGVTSANTTPKIKLWFILDQSQTWSNARNLRQHKCRPMLKLTKWINVAILCGPYLPHGAFVEFFTLSWAIERWNLSFMSLLLSLLLKSIIKKMIAMILWFLNIRHSGTLFDMWFLTLAQQMFLLILPSKG